MAFNGELYIQKKLKTPAVHHESYKQLWETKWKKPCDMGVYPFMFGCTKDFQPVVDELVKRDFKEPYDWDEYAPVYFPKAEELVSEAEKAEKEGHKEKASELYLRASAVYRISRFPAPRSEKQRHAWTEGKKACLKGLSLREHPVHEVMVPHKHRTEGEGDVIPIYHQLPEGASKENPAPTVLIMTGLDGYRTELVTWAEGWRQKGVGVIIVKIPGTGDSPALPKDPTSPDREWSSLLDWADSQEGIDSKRICVWAFSTGGFYAIRLAHTHPDRLAGVVALGGGTHHMFDKDWLDNVNHLEYPFDLASTLAYKFGYGNDLETFKKEASDKFSLLKDGTLDKPECARLFLVNGVEDEIFPIDDYYLAICHGAPKEVRFVPDRKHMGEPESFVIILKWIYKLFGIEGNPVDQLKTIPFKPKY
ncbi:Alpha/Beta hydrolase protein [Cryomyces antarcticus]